MTLFRSRNNETDGTGVPVRASQTAGRPGKGEDGKAGTREVKLARLFTVSALDADGGPVMDPGSSSYTFTFDGKDALADLVKAEYLRRGGEHHRQVVALGDGAAWIWTMAGDLYPHATHIVDIYHAREHLTDLAAHLAFITPDPAQWLAWSESSGTSATTPAGCVTSTSATWVCSSAPAPSREASKRSWSSAPSSPACTGPPRAPPTSSPCAASTPAAGGTSYGRPAQTHRPGCAPSDRQQDSDAKAAGPSKIIPNKAVVHPERAGSVADEGGDRYVEPWTIARWGIAAARCPPFALGP